MSDSQFSTRRFPRSGRWVLAGLGLCLLLLAVRFGLPIWRRAAFIDDVERVGGKAATDPGGPEWLRNLAGDSAMRGFDSLSSVKMQEIRVDDDLLRRTLLFPELSEINLDGASFRGTGMAALSALPELRFFGAFDSDLDDEGVVLLSNSQSISVISAGYTHVTDRSLSHLGKMSQLIFLGLKGDDVGDAGVSQLASLKNLTDLNLAETRITDSGLRHLESLQDLQRASLFDTPVTEAGVRDFVEKHPKLKNIQLSPDQISADGMDDLKRQRPNLEIVIMVEENDGSGFSRRRQRP